MKSTSLRQYYELAKPGIIYGNLLTAAAAFIFAARHILLPAGGIPGSLTAFVGMLVGLGFSIGAACVVNNVIDRDIDAHMERTKARALVQKEISVTHALIYALILAAVGFSVLFVFTTMAALLVTIFGVVSYVGLYTPAKRVTVHSTIIGALAGAVPPVVGYAAVTNLLDLNALLLFLILVCWQMPHFFAIGLYRSEEYRAAGLPIMPVRAGRAITQALIVIYAVLFGAAVLLFGFQNHLSFFYTLVMGIASIVWIAFGVFGFRKPDPTRWARRMFSYSLIVLLLLSAMLAAS